MNRTLVILAAALALAAGCEPQAQRTTPAWVNPLDLMEPNLPADPKDSNYVLARMEFGRQAILLGSYTRARPRLREAFDQLEVEHDNVGAALSSERLKYYKGETFERAMLCTYLGILAYLDGNYNDARILLSRALVADRAAVVNEKTPAEVGEDFGLAYYWLAKAYAKLGDADNAAIALRKATTRTPRKVKDAERESKEDAKAAGEALKKRPEGEAWVYQTFHNPEKPDLYIEPIVNLAEAEGTLAGAPAVLQDAAPASPVRRSVDKPEEFFTPAFQTATNLVLTVDLGRCPYKYLGGISGERTEFGRSPVCPRAVRVYIDGHYAGPAFQVLDLWDQASTQDRIGEKEAAQTTKAVLREMLSYAPYAGSAASNWDVSGDIRHWTTLPGKVFVFAADVAPGPHTVRIEMYDINGARLPRWTNTYYGIGVPKTGEAYVSLAPWFDGDNRLGPEDVRKAVAGGAEPASTYGF
jgi:tetratricopeptide (TPR) repeat protein